MSALRVAVLGPGRVGGSLAAAFLAAGHTVVLAGRPGGTDGVRAARDADPRLARAEVAEPLDAVTGADLTVLAVPFAALTDLLPPLATALAGATVVDATNPVGPGLRHGLESRKSGGEHVASLLPGAHVVKAFSIYGYEHLAAPPAAAPGGPHPLMFFAGDDAGAKARVAGLLDDLGWDPVDAGPLAAALDLEHLTLLWVRMVRLGGRDPHPLWAALPADRP